MTNPEHPTPEASSSLENDPIASAESTLDLLPMFDEMLKKQGGDIAVQNMGDRQMIVLGHPEYVRAVFTQPAFAEKGEAYRRVVGPVIGDGIVVSSGQKWQRHRREMTSPFRPQMVRRRVDEIAEVGNDFVNDLLRRTETGAPVHLQTEMTRLTFRTISRFLGGKELAHLTEELISLPDLQAVFDSIRQLLGQEATEEQKQRTAQSLANLDTALQLLVQTAREQHEDETPLSKLAYAHNETTGEPWKDEDIRNELVTLLFAGHETVKLSLTWLLYALQQHPEVLTKVRQELAAVPKDITTSNYHTHLPYLHNVIDEMWRLWPPTPIISRSATQHTQLGGIAIAPKDEVIVSLWHAQRHPHVWEAPDRTPPDQFDPNRFPLREHERLAYFPFAYGARNCMGQALARTEIVTLAAILLRRTDIQILPGKEILAVADLTLQPSRPLIARIGRLAID